MKTCEDCKFFVPMIFDERMRGSCRRFPKWENKFSNHSICGEFK